MSKGFIYDNQASLWGSREVIGFGTEDFHVKELDRNKANALIVKNHYSGKFYNATYINLGVYVQKELLGVLQYGYAMNPASCGSVVEGTNMDQYLELNRMWIADDVGDYPESRAVAYSIKFIKNKYKKIKWIQSFADERCGGLGIVYQACSFSFYGEHKAVFWTLKGQIYHNSLMTRNPKLSKSAAYLQANKEDATNETLRQFRYIKFLDSRWVNKCLLKQKGYPKHYSKEEKERK